MDFPVITNFLSNRNLAAEKKQLSDEVHSLERKVSRERKEGEKHSSQMAKYEAEIREKMKTNEEKSDLSTQNGSVGDTAVILD